jgi:hypothetical protein
VPSSKPVLGVNDLQTKFPEIAAEANRWDPTTVTGGSPKKKNWICNLGHTWDAKIKSRTSQNTGCPICSNRQVLAGFNDLQAKFPEIAAEANGWDPTTVSAGSHQKMNWICNLGHTWDAIINSRTSQNRGCPICSNQKVLAGFNDLQTKFPEIAAEANGWDPASVSAGSDKKMNWICNLGHTWDALIFNRTLHNTGCPICSNQKVLLGFNDLQTKHPEVAAEANGWDPTTVSAGSHQKMNWICNLGHTWDAIIKSRTLQNTGCPICSSNQVLAGVNDLQAKFPEIAAEAKGWDPTTVFAGSGKKKNWVCNLGHTWSASISNRTIHNSGCSVCSNRQVLAGFNDLQTKFPEIAAEANGWDPTTVTGGSPKKKNWICNLGHTWDAVVSKRTYLDRGCPICSNKQVLAGFNDLQTKFPEIAAEANGWDPTTVSAGSDKRMNWMCNLGHTWDALIYSRTSGRGCPICAKHGFNPDKNAWFYLMHRAGEQQFGITNDLKTRLRIHERNGWILLEHTEPAQGKRVWETEAVLKKWLKKNIGVMEGTAENWATTSMEVHSLAELKAKSGIETGLF